MEDTSSLQTLLGNSETSLIPDSLVTTLTVSFIVINILGVLFLIFYVLGIVRKWRVQTAVFEIRKDLAEIKAQLATPTPKFNPIVEPASENKVIAQEPQTEELSSSDDSRIG